MGSLMNGFFRKLVILLAFAAMIVVNVLATTGGINNVTTAAVSDSYKTIFTPEGYTFAIWGAIYLFLAVYVLFQLFSTDLREDGRMSKIAFWFIASCLVNIGWIFAWHYKLIITSMIAMAVLLSCVSRNLWLAAEAKRSFANLVSLEIPFGLYAGWLSVATIANFAAMSYSRGWNYLGIPKYIVMIVALLIATAIAVAISGDTKSLAYPLAVGWGFAGVLTRYLPQFKLGADSEPMWIVFTLGACLLVLAVRWINTLAFRLSKNR